MKEIKITKIYKNNNMTLKTIINNYLKNAKQ